MQGWLVGGGVVIQWSWRWKDDDLGESMWKWGSQNVKERHKKRVPIVCALACYIRFHTCMRADFTLHLLYPLFPSLLWTSVDILKIRIKEQGQRCFYIAASSLKAWMIFTMKMCQPTFTKKTHYQKKVLQCYLWILTGKFDDDAIHKTVT